jgi:hypothetical protein
VPSDIASERGRVGARRPGRLRILGHHPCACQDEETASEPGNDLAVGRNFLQQHKDAECSNPKKIHDAPNEQQHHQRPATADTVEAVTQAERHSAAWIASGSSTDSASGRYARPVALRSRLLLFPVDFGYLYRSAIRLYVLSDKLSSNH